MTDKEIKETLFQAADAIGIASKRADFVTTAVNTGDITYPLFVLSPLTSQMSNPDQDFKSVTITCYFFVLDALESSDGRMTDTNEDEKWEKYSEVSDYAYRFCRLLQDRNHPVRNMRIERNAYAIGTDETIFTKLTFTLTAFKSC